MLDGAHASAGGVADAGGAVAVRRHGEAEAGCSGNDGTHFAAVELGIRRAASGRQIAAGGHHLDEVNTRCTLPLHHFLGLLNARRLAIPEMAMATDGRDGLPGAYEPRPDDFAGGDAVPEFQFQPSSTAKIPRRRDAGPHHGLGPHWQLCANGGVALAHLRRRRLQGRVQHHVNVRVDEARNDGEASAVLAAPALADGRDLAVLHRDGVGIEKIEIAVAATVPDAKTREHVGQGILLFSCGRSCGRRGSVRQAWTIVAI